MTPGESAPHAADSHFWEFLVPFRDIRAPEAGGTGIAMRLYASTRTIETPLA